MRTCLVLAVLACPGCARTAPAAPQTPPASMADLLARSPADDWRAIPPEDTIYMDLPSGRVVIELAPRYAPNHATNIRALAREDYYDGAAIVRA